MRGLGGRLTIAVALVVAIATAFGVTVAVGGKRGSGGPAANRVGATPQASAAKARNSAAARAVRHRSRRAFANAKRTDAVRIARRAHPRVAKSRLWQAVPVQGRDRVARYLGAHEARIDRGPGRPAAIVQNDLPLRAKTDAGRQAPVRLAFGPDAGGGFAPANPLVDLRAARTLGGGVAFPDVDVTVIPTGRKRAAGELVSGRAFYANADTDTDWLVKPIPEGLQTFAQLRSERSPERLGLRFRLPAGARIANEDDGPGGYVIEDAAGKALARFGPPRAWDADGQPVAAGARLIGDTLRIQAEHRGRDVRYPIMVDPSVVEDRFQWKDQIAPNTDYTPHWTFLRSDVNKYKMFSGSSYLGHGLYSYTRTSLPYTTADYAEWRMTARGYGDAFIYQATFDKLYHDGYNTATSLYTGLWNPGPRTWEPGSPKVVGPGFYDYRPHPHCARLDCSVNGTKANVAVFGTRPDTNAQRSNFTDYMGGAAIFQSDAVIPSLSATTIPTAWVKAAPGMTATFSDTGLGMQSATVATEPAKAWTHTVGLAASSSKTATTDCDGTRHKACPKDRPVTFDSGDLADGVTTLRLTGVDILGVPGTTTRRLKLDNAGTKLEPSGPVATERYVAPGALLRVKGTDGVNTTDATRRAGVKRIDVFVDGAEVDRQPDKACPEDSCELTRDFRLNVAEGEHTVEVKAYDHADNPSTLPAPLRVYVDDMAPLPVNTARPTIKEPANATAVGEELEANEGSWSNLQPGHSFEYQWQSCDAQGANCADILGATRKKHRSTPDQLDRTLRVRVTAVNPGSEGQQPGRASATSDQSRKITPDVVDPLLPLVVHDPPLPADWVDDHHAKVTGHATDVGLGVKQLDLTEPLDPTDATRTQRFQTPLTTQDCDGTTARMCPPAGSKTFSYGTSDVRSGENPRPYREGIVRPKLEAVDGANRRSKPPATWMLKVDRSAPDVVFGDVMRDRENGAITTAGQYRLTVNTTDGVRGGTEAQQRSGVASVELLVSKDEGGFVSQGVSRNDACTGDSCPGPEVVYTVDTAVLGEGLHAIKVVARDRLWSKVPAAQQPRHEKVRVLKFYIDLVTPTLGAVSHTPALPTGWVNAVPLSVNAAATDDSTGLHRFALTSGTFATSARVKNGALDCILSVENDRRCPQTGGSAKIDYNTRDLAEGADVKVRVHGVDAVERVTQANVWSLKVDHTPPPTPEGFAATWSSETGTGVISWFPVADALSGTQHYLVRHKRAGAADFTAWRMQLEDELDIGTVTGNETVAVEVKAVDWANIESPVGSASLTVGRDANGPVFGDDIQLTGGARPDGYAKISWLPPDEGDTESGVAGYTVRHRPQCALGATCAPWSAAANTEYPWVELTGAAVGHGYDLEIQAYDYAGNNSAVKAGIVVLGAFEGCDEDEPNVVECEEGEDADHDEELGNAQDVEFEEDTSTASRRDAYEARRRKLVARRAGCRSRQCYITIRSFHGSWVVGMIKVPHESQTRSAYVDWTRESSGYWFGSVSGLGRKCGWVGVSAGIGKGADRTSDCNPDGDAATVRPNFSRFQYPDYKGNNCFSADKRKPIYKTVNGVRKRSACTHGTAIFLVEDATLCQSVGFTFRDGRQAKTGKCSGAIRRLTKGSCVDWRYITRDGRYVMVTDTNNTKEGGEPRIVYGGWGFVRRSAFSKNRLAKYVEGQNTGGWPGIYQRSTCNTGN